MTTPGGATANLHDNTDEETPSEEQRLRHRPKASNTNSETSQDDPDSLNSQDICRVCRCEGTPDRPLFHPCICTGSIKYIHQECLLQWLRYSKKEFCELCNHRFSFTPIYSPDMPKRLPFSIICSGFLGTVAHAVRFWLHYTIVAVAWLGVVPLTACRIYRTLFTGSVSTILSLPINVFSTENIAADILQGCVVVTLTLLAFIGLIWLREQILHGGGPEWLEQELEDDNQQQEQQHRLPEENQDNHEDNDEAQARDDLEDVFIDNLPAEPAAPEIEADEQAPLQDEGNDQVNDGNNEDGQWNPMEWNGGAEELTWERLLGLDGSLVFLEHVFWVVSLNTFFILVFAFCPYHIGHFAITGFKLKHLVSGAHFEGMFTTLCGYCIIGMSMVLLHYIAATFRLKKWARLLGLCYVVVKVALLLVIEVVAVPVTCGWWLDICSLSLFDATLKDRKLAYHNSPMASMFFHWLFGMIYVFYFVFVVFLLREVLRPGVLWFLRNLNDPDFNPIQEMIHLSITRHLRRFCATIVMFGSSILIMLYLPSKIIKIIFPDFLPYQTSQSNEGQVDELAMQLMLLMVILPSVQDQNHTREWLKNLVRAWCSVAAWIFDLRSYLFGDVNAGHDENTLPEGQQNQGAWVNADGDGENHQGDDAPLGGGLGAVHQALLQRETPTGFQPYHRPPLFHLRICGLLILMVISWLFASLIVMVAPVWLGRRLFDFCIGETTPIYELYTSFVGLFICLLTIKFFALVSSWLQQGWNQLFGKLRDWTYIAVKAGFAMTLLVGVIPLMVGLLIELVVLTPVRVMLNQSPVYFLWQDWALGAMYTKITIALTFMGPEWWLKAAIERLYQDGIRGLSLSFLIPELIVPVCSGLGLTLALPYLSAHSIAPMLISDEDILIIIQRRIYPFLLLLVVIVAVVIFQLRQCRKLYEHIKNDRYLVGRRLVNYNHQGTNTSSN